MGENTAQFDKLKGGRGKSFAVAQDSALVR